MSELWLPSRRQFVRNVAFGATAFTTSGLFADLLTKTPFQTEGPFYPDKLPLDTDNDLLIINDDITPAVGEITHLGGRILDEKGSPIRNAVVEIWQVNAKARYIHTADVNQGPSDPHFQGFGRFMTGSKGEYYFRTIKPVPYPGRTPHIHFKIKRKGFPEFTTQCYIKGHELNQRDGVLRRFVNDKEAWDSVMVDFKKMEDSKIGELAANFDVVIGTTPEDTDEISRQRSGDGFRGGRGPSR